AGEQAVLVAEEAVGGGGELRGQRDRHRALGGEGLQPGVESDPLRMVVGDDGGVDGGGLFVGAVRVGAQGVAVFLVHEGVGAGLHLVEHPLGGVGGEGAGAAAGDDLDASAGGADRGDRGGQFR